VDTYDASKPGRSCTTCGKLKNDSGFLQNRKLNECKDCINQYRRAHNRQLAFDKYVAAPSSDEAREPPCKSNAKMNRDELKIYGQQQKRRCTKCGIVRDFSFYHKAKGGTFGLSSNCKFCKSRAERKSDFVPKRVKTTRVVPNVNTQ